MVLEGIVLELSQRRKAGPLAERSVRKIVKDIAPRLEILKHSNGGEEELIKLRRDVRVHYELTDAETIHLFEDFITSYLRAQPSLQEKIIPRLPEPKLQGLALVKIRSESERLKAMKAYASQQRTTIITGKEQSLLTQEANSYDRLREARKGDVPHGFIRYSEYTPQNQKHAGFLLSRCFGAYLMNRGTEGRQLLREISNRWAQLFTGKGFMQVRDVISYKDGIQQQLVDLVGKDLSHKDSFVIAKSKEEEALYRNIGFENTFMRSTRYLPRKSLILARQGQKPL